MSKRAIWDATIGLAGLCIDLGMSRLNRWLLRWHPGAGA